MIYVTGDCHADFTRFNTRDFPDQKKLTKDDYVIICGDFGGVWKCGDDIEKENDNLEWLEERPFTTLFVDGNHENYERLLAFPVEQWKGGKIQRIRQSVIHLMRGQVYDIDGTSIFTFGGARSHDISDGIIDMDDPEYEEKRAYLDRINGSYRIRGRSWWDEEMPNEAEFEEGLANLEKHGFEVDYVITHCASTIIQDAIHMCGRFGFFSKDELTHYFDHVRERLGYKKWYFGHYHEEQNVTTRDILLYNRIIRLGDIITEDIPEEPRFAQGDLVEFKFSTQDGYQDIKGRIFAVDPYGPEGEGPLYSITVTSEDGEEQIYEYVHDSNIRFAESNIPPAGSEY